MLTVRISWEPLSVYVKLDTKEMAITALVRIPIPNLYSTHYENDYLTDIYTTPCKPLLKIFTHIVLYTCKSLYHCYYKIGICP